MEPVKFIRCEICGNLFDVIQDSGAVPVCCGKPMIELKANSTDAAGEKHVPVIQRDGNTVTVKVGSVAHPMTEEHYIQWIAIEHCNVVQRAKLRPGDVPEATFIVCCDDAVTAYEYCNLHGLWKATK